jgi:hypothetical protein
VRLEIRPEPTSEERAALVAALRQLEETRPQPPADAWRRAALDDDDHAVTPPPHTRPGAARP